MADDPQRINDLERLFRDLTINIEEVWSADGNEITGFRATAAAFETPSRPMGEAVRPGRLSSSDDVEELLRLLVADIAKDGARA